MEGKCTLLSSVDAKINVCIHQYIYVNMDPADRMSLKERNRAYYLKHREETLKKYKEKYIENKQEILDKNKIYHEKNKEKINKTRKIYVKNHKAHIKEYQIEYRKKNKERLIKKNKEYRCRVMKNIIEYRNTHREELSRLNKAYYKTPRGIALRCRSDNKRRSRTKCVENTLTLDQWNKILKWQNNKCAMCKREFSKTLKPARDHIIPLSMGGGLTFDNIQALCKSCNSKKLNKLDRNIITIWLNFPT